MARQTTAEINALLIEGVASKDGAVEPIEIRDVVTRRVRPQDASHKIWGSTEEGNINDRMSSEVIVNMTPSRDVKVGTFPFEDESDVVGSLSLPSESISPDNRKKASFVDNQETNGVIVSSYMQNDLTAALRAMRPPTVNYQPPTYSQLGSNGFDY